jgi:NADH:ubiquinone oxidoreductase subunit H
MLYIYIFNTILLVVILINLTLIAGILPLIERKVLSLMQRRVGPYFLGYRGRLQFIADAIKILVKDFFVPYKANKKLFVFCPVIILTLCYFLWLNIFWGKNLFFYEIEYNLILLLFIGLFNNLFILLTGYYSNNKYAFLGSIRTSLIFFILELLMSLFFLNILLLNKSFSFIYLWNIQEELYLAVYFFYLIPFICIIVLLEVNKAPFDLSEAESELVTGFHTEYGSFLFGLYYLGEYFHIYFFSIVIIVLIGGC